jgi:dinuclear metal center YbgI/SA1388 family protein
MPADRDAILQYLHTYLDVPGFQDYGPQGLQVEGRHDVTRVVSGVSACIELFEAASAAKADMILVHHGVLWDAADRVVKGAFRRRLALLLERDITLAAYHLCLDAHATLGNNVLGARALGLEQIEPWGEHRGRAIGFRGHWPEPLSASDALDRIAAAFAGQPLAFMDGPALIRTVGVISGGAQRDVYAAIESGLDLFVTGEASEFVMHAAREGAIHFVAAGHHNTERLGIRALGDHVSERFGVDHVFIDTPNPV